MSGSALMPKLQGLRTNELDHLRFEYFENGTAQYVAGRFTYYATFASPVAANLFHVAIEMFLKGCLLGVGLTEEERKNKLHKLNDIWTLFRVHAPDPALDKYEETVRKLDAFHVFRYPENARRRFKSCTIITGPLMPDNNAPDLHCDIDEVDSLVAALLTAGSVNSKALATHLRTEGLEMLRRHNAHAAIWA